jgi:hypothetical protein
MSGIPREEPDPLLRWFRNRRHSTLNLSDGRHSTVDCQSTKQTVGFLKDDFKSTR